MIPVKKKQHFVPKFYLRYFTGLDNKFFTYDFFKGGLLTERTYYESQCHKKYFYGEDGVLEDRLSQKEGQWARVCKKAIIGEPLSEEDISLLKEFVLYQKQRTNDKYNHARSDRESLLEEYVRMIYNQRGWECNDDVKELCKKRAAEEVTPAENVEMARQLLKYLDDLALLIIHYNTCNKLLTTDSPVVTLNAFMEFIGFGYDNIGIALLMPLTPQHLVIVYDDHLYTKFKDKIYIESSNEEEVIVINKYELIHAERMAFSEYANNFDAVTEEILDYRQKEIERNKMQFLGPKNTGRLMISQAEGTRNYYELRYIFLPREYRRIPFNCREAIPRHFQKGWDDKLAMKYNVLSMTIKIEQDSEIKSIIPSKGDLRIGCKRMAELARKYWRSRGYNI